MGLHRFLVPRRWLALGLLLVVIACSSDDTRIIRVSGGDDDHDDHSHSGARCPPTVPDTNIPLPSYNNFGKAFFDDYCLRCHSTQLTGADRNGAPEDRNFDTLELIRDQRHLIDGVAAFGSLSENDIMPQSNPKPTDTERKVLGQWLACGGPEGSP